MFTVVFIQTLTIYSCFCVKSYKYVILGNFHFVMRLVTTYTLFYESHPISSLSFETKPEPNLSLKSFVNPS